MNRFISSLLALGALGLAVAAVGFLMPAAQSARREAMFQGRPEQVWAVLADFSGHPAWRESIQRVQALPDRDGRPCWRELGDDYERSFEVVEYRPASRLVIAFADDKNWFQGTWAFELKPEQFGRTRVTLSEVGQIDNVLMRVACATIFDRTEGQAELLEELAEALGQEVEVYDPDEPEKPRIQTLF